MKTISEFKSPDGAKTSIVYWYPRPKMWLVRYYAESKKIGEKLFELQEAAVESAGEYVIYPIPGADTDYVVVDPE